MPVYGCFISILCGQVLHHVFVFDGTIIHIIVFQAFDNSVRQVGVRHEMLRNVLEVNHFSIPSRDQLLVIHVLHILIQLHNHHSWLIAVGWGS
jgi:hypothetical protein